MRGVKSLACKGRGRFVGKCSRREGKVLQMPEPYPWVWKYWMYWASAAPVKVIWTKSYGGEAGAGAGAAATKVVKTARAVEMVKAFILVLG